MAVKVSTLVSRIQRRLEDTKGLHWPTTEIIAAINEARTDFYDYVYARNRDVLNSSQYEYDWPANILSVSLPSMTGLVNGTFDVLLISVTPTTDTTSSTNLPVPIRRVPFEELYRHGTNRDLFYANYYDNAGSPTSWSNRTQSYEATLRWAKQGQMIYLDPVPLTAIQLRIEVLKRFADFDEDLILSGASQVFSLDDAQFERWVRIIEYSATLILKGRSDEREDPVLMQMQTKRLLLDSWLDSQSNTGTPRISSNGY